MYGSWTENVVLWRHFLGFIWDVLNVLMMYNYWVWAQSKRSQSLWEWTEEKPDGFKSYVEGSE